MIFTKTLRISCLLSLFLVSAIFSNAQPFVKDIEKFKQQDSVSFPPEKAILFIGSSSFTKWTDVQEYFPKKKIINRGFGGSTLVDVIRYADDIIFPYNPKQVVIYCGENDLASSDTIQAQTVIERFMTLYGMIKEKLPKTSIVYLAMKPSPSRRKIFGKETVVNGTIRDFLNTTRDDYYVDTFYPMMAKKGSMEPNGALFTADSLHMNADGYKLWKYLMSPYLVNTR